MVDVLNLGLRLALGGVPAAMMAPEADY